MKQLKRSMLSPAWFEISSRMPLKEYRCANSLLFQTLSVKRLMNLSNRTESLVEGVGNPPDFEVLHAVFTYVARKEKITEIPTMFELTDERLQKILGVFAKRLPIEEEEAITYP